jgi:hypothetical protein
MVNLTWLFAAAAAAAAAAGIGSNRITLFCPLILVSAFCLYVACKWQADGVPWIIKTINAIASCIWPLSGLGKGKLNRRVFEALSLYTLSRRTPARVIDARGIRRQDIYVPRLAAHDGVAECSTIKIRLYQQKQPQQQQQQKQQPLIVYFHGGGFTVSHIDSADYDSLCSKFARRYSPPPIKLAPHLRIKRLS